MSQESNQENRFPFDMEDLPFDEYREEPTPEETEEEWEEPEEPERPARRPRAKRAQKKNPVVVYLSILFAVAFLLLLLSFFGQQRDRAAMEEMNVNLDSQQETIEDLQAEKQQLMLELQDAKDEVKEAESFADDAETAKKTALACEYLSQMERACRTSYLEGFRIAKEMESKGLRAYLPTTSAVSGCPSPAKVYQELCSTIFGNLG